MEKKLIHRIGKKIFPAMAPLEIKLEKLLGGSTSLNVDDGSIMREWEMPNLTIGYVLNPMEAPKPFQYVWIGANHINGEKLNNPGFSTSKIYSFEVDTGYLSSIKNAEDGSFNYSLLLPNYNGLLDDKHTSGEKVPVMGQDDFVKEISKILKYQ